VQEEERPQRLLHQVRNAEAGAAARAEGLMFCSFNSLIGPGIDDDDWDDDDGDDEWMIAEMWRDESGRWALINLVCFLLCFGLVFVDSWGLFWVLPAAMNLYPAINNFRDYFRLRHVT
jgi:hypothetical protein